MANIEVNDTAWNGLSDADKAQVTASLKKYRLLAEGDSIVGNPSIPAPDPGQEGFFDDYGEALCIVGCDAAAAAAIASLTLTGPALAAALVAIGAAREACREAC